MCVLVSVCTYEYLTMFLIFHTILILLSDIFVVLAEASVSRDKKWFYAYFN